MSRPLWVLAASASILACRPAGDSGTKATPSAVVSSTAISSSVSSEAPPIVKPPALEADTDAGIAEASVTRILCGRHAPPHCRFQGRVRTVRAVVLAPGDQPIDPHDGLTRATEVVLDKVAPLECASMQLGGVQQGNYRGGVTERNGPVFSYGGEMAVVRELLVTLGPGLHLPFAEGELICGSVMVFTAGFGGRAHEALITRPNGDVLLDYAPQMPRESSPTLDWTFTFGQQRTFQRQWSDFDMVVTHRGVSVKTTFTGAPARLRAPDGEFLVEGNGYVRVGPHSDENESYDGFLAKKGYGFSIVRVGPGSQPDPVPTPSPP